MITRAKRFSRHTQGKFFREDKNISFNPDMLIIDQIALERRENHARARTIAD